MLLVDLDLQGSLTGMFLSEARQDQLFGEKRMVRDFLLAAADGEFPNILDHAADVLPGTKSAIVPTTEALAYAEMNMTVRWFLKDGIRDPRFLLRRELHLKRVTDRFDIVLIDCPPFLNVSCVNALAASDYVLTPVTPSKQSTDRVTILLERLKEFRTNLNPLLKMMGFFANRTKQSGLTLDEEKRLAGLRTRCHDAWGEKVHRFGASIRQSVDIREAEDQHRPLGPGDDMFPAYLALAAEVEDQLPMFCRVVRSVAVAEGVA